MSFNNGICASVRRSRMKFCEFWTNKGFFYCVSMQILVPDAGNKRATTHNEIYHFLGLYFQDHTIFFINSYEAALSLLIT